MQRKFFLLLFMILTAVSCKQKSSDSDDKLKTLTVSSNDYRIGLYKDVELDPQKITHIIIVGSAVKEDSDQFFQSGLSRAYRYKELYPKHQVVIMSSPDVKGMSNDQVFAKYKIPVVKTVYRKFTADILLTELERFDKMASFDFYGHSSPWAMIIGNIGAAFDPTAHYDRLKRMRSKFTDNAYATLNACNTGFYLSPALSYGLGIPVSGSLTSSLFERIEEDGFWYKEEDATPSRYVEYNTKSFTKNVSCALGLCTRMKSSRGNYSSYWGDFNQGGLSFDKFFCNYENANDGRCERGMAMSLLSFPSVRPINTSSSEEEFKSVVYDWLCSTGNSKFYFTKCVYGIEDAIFRGDLEYQSHPGNELDCDFKSCHAKIACKHKQTDDMGPIPGTCSVVTETNYRPTNVAREYLSLMRGFEAIRN